MTIAEMRNFARENGLRGYSRHRRRDDLINFLRNNYQLQTWEPRQWRGLSLPDHLHQLLQLGLDQIDLDN